MLHRNNFFLHLPVALALIFSVTAVPSSADASSAALAKTILVAPVGIDNAGCGTDSQPCRTIQYAVNSAASGDTILVAEGVYTYNPDLDRCSFLVTRSVVCFVNKDLTIIGGYSADDWSVPDSLLHPTIIDGQDQWRGVAVIANNSSARLGMQGFIIRNGRASGRTTGDDYYRHAFGGGLWAQHGSVNLKDMLFENNTAVGGSTSSLASGGWALGGGVALEGPQYGATSILENISFIGNQALAGDGKTSGGIAQGGALFVGQSVVIATGLTFTSNLARAGDSPGNGVDPARGVTADSFGGAAALGNNSNVTLLQTRAVYNQSIGGNAGTGAQAHAGAGLGGAFHIEHSTFSLTDSTLEHNQAIGGIALNGGVGMGGGIMTDKAQVTMNRVKIVANIAQSGSSSNGGSIGPVGGGGVFLTAYSETGAYQATLSNCLFAENAALLGEYGAPNSGGGGGGGLVVQAMTVNATHLTFANNSLDQRLNVGQAIQVQALNVFSGKPGILNLKYSLISDHINPFMPSSSALTNFSGSITSLSYVWFGNNTHHTNENGAPLPPGTFHLDHVWKETVSAGFVRVSSSESDYHIRSDSPVIDLGYNSQTMIDLDKLPRPFGLVQDLGSYEFIKPTLQAEFPTMGFMVDTNQTFFVENQISVTIGSLPLWMASCDADWIYLEPSQSALMIWIDPSKVDLGIHTATIELSSENANPASIEITLNKVQHISRSYLPSISR